MTYEVRITPAALKQLAHLPKSVQPRIDIHLLALAEDPRPPGSKKLAGGLDLYRIRVGDYRVLYQIQDAHLLVLIIKIGQRGGIYRGHAG
jgi:mRNA interferase RelE/StbE